MKQASMTKAYPIKALVFSLLIVTAGCTDTSHPTGFNPSKRSLATAAPFNQGKGNFQVYLLKEQEKDPSMVFIEGRMINLNGTVEKSPHDSVPQVERTVSVASFFIRDTVTQNRDYIIYLDDLKANGSEKAYKEALPDETVWERPLAFNDSLFKNYFRSLAFSEYPVVGVSWVQANAYCEWRTHAVNKFLAERAGREYDPEGENIELVEAGITVPGYRLLSEAEWECAARSMSIQEGDILQATQRMYAWDGYSLRVQEGIYAGRFQANCKRGYGNYTGLPGESDSNGATCSVYAYPPNEEGVYIGRGNVREWVLDLYRPLSPQDVEDFNPVRRDDTGDPAEGYANSPIDNKSRVIKGASYNDCAYWAQIGTKRYLDEEESNAMTGFRCAMTSLGDMSQ